MIVVAFRNKDLTHLADLKSDSGNITNSVTLTSETADQHLIVLLDKVQATVIGDEGGDLLAVLDQLHTNALPDSGVGLLGLNADLLEDNSLWKRFVIQKKARIEVKKIDDLLIQCAVGIVNIISLKQNWLIYHHKNHGRIK